MAEHNAQSSCNIEAVNNKKDKLVLKRRLMCEVLFNSKKTRLSEKFDELNDFIVTKTSISKEKLDFELRNFKSQFSEKWTACGRHAERFYSSESKWLNGDYQLYFTSSTGRPTVNFSESSHQTKRRKTSELRSKYSSDELAYAAQMKLRASGNAPVAQMIKEITEKKDAEDRSNYVTIKKVTPSDALSVIVEAQLSRKQYNAIRKSATKVYPSYKHIQKEKKKFYPQRVKVSESESSVPVQDLLDHTSSRLLKFKQDMLSNVATNDLVMYSKWGFDGSSGHTLYMQQFLDEKADDKYIFLASLVPLRLLNKNNQQVLWQNPLPSSTRFCRPIKLQYKKETEELVKNEKKNINFEISSLQPSSIALDNHIFSIEHKLMFTMVDGKICNSLSDTKSPLVCYLCGARSVEFNDIEKVITRPVNHEYVSFGISVLHAWIRLFECFLHIGYKMPVKSWRVNKENKEIVQENKNRIQTDFYKNLSLIIDKSKPGFGNTNNGNVARIFFQNYEKSSEILGVDQILIKRLYIVLQTISSGREINVEKCNTFCLETAHIYTNLYPWYHMSTTLHKILIHGGKIVKEALLPIGQLSEEALECSNKDFKNFRENYSRKTSRADNLQDVFNRLLVSSDPLLTCSRSLPMATNRKSFFPEALELMELEVPRLECDSDSDEQG